MKNNPFYIKTENLDSADIKNLWEVAMKEKVYPYHANVRNHQIFNYIGINYNNVMVYSDKIEDYSEPDLNCFAEELTYEQAILNIQESTDNLNN